MALMMSPYNAPRSTLSLLSLRLKAPPHAATRPSHLYLPKSEVLPGFPNPWVFIPCPLLPVWHGQWQCHHLSGFSCQYLSHYHGC